MHNCCAAAQSSRLAGFIRDFVPNPSARKASWFFWGCLLVLSIVWPVPSKVVGFHRNLPLYLGFISCVVVAIRQRVRWCDVGKPVKPLLPWLTVLSICILVVGLWRRPDPVAFLAVYNAKWLRVLMTGYMGLMLLPLFMHEKQRLRPVDLFWGVVCALWLITLLQFCYDIRCLLIDGQLPFRYTPFSYSVMEMSVHANIVIAILLSEVVARLVLKQRWLPISAGGLWGMTVVAIASMLTLAVRNASAGLLLMIILTLLLTLILRFHSWSKWRLLGCLLIGILVVSAVGVFSWKTDHRWQHVAQTIPVAWDTEHHQSWQDRKVYPLPHLPDGSMVEESTYERVAWIKIGLWLIKQEPWGRGIYGYNFHQMVEQYFGKSSTTSQSHSGLINWTIANGILGTVLLLVIVSQVLVIAARSFYRDGKSQGLILMMLIIGFLTRSLVDDVWRDSMLEELFFLVGLLLVLCSAGGRATEAPAARAGHEGAVATVHNDGV